MIQLLLSVSAVVTAVLAFFAWLAHASDARVMFAQTGAALFLMILAVVLVATLTTRFYIRVVGKIADRESRRRFSSFMGWKFLRSQEVKETRPSRLLHALDHFALRSRWLHISLIFLGLLFLALALALQVPATWNSVSKAFSPFFSSVLLLSSFFLTGFFLLMAALGLLHRPKAKREPKLRLRSAVTLPTFISIVGVAIGLWALVVVLGVMHGLQDDLRSKILLTNAHLTIDPKDPTGSIPEPEKLLQELRQRPHLEEALPFVRGEVMMASTSSTAINIVIKGMDSEDLAASKQLKGKVLSGSLQALQHPELLSNFEPFDEVQRRLSKDLLPSILLGIELAYQLHVTIGDEVELISPDGDVGPTGLRPKLKRFRVAGIFETGMYEYDQKLAYLNLYAAQDYFDFGDSYNGIEARFSKPEYALKELAHLGALKDAFPSLQFSSFRERNQSLFSALALESIVMFIILGFIVLVASLLIVSSLAMLVVEKVREISVLKTLGAKDQDILKSFLYIGAFIGLFGILSGIPLSVLTLLGLITEGVSLPAEFYISELPVKLDFFEITLFSVVALIVCLLATLYPAKRASRLHPADGIRHG